MLLFSKSTERNIDYESQWYFGGVAATAASLFTYPLEVVKTPLQIRRSNVKLSEIAHRIIQKQGFSGLYYGISSHLMKMFTYSLCRFALYDIFKSYCSNSSLSGKVTSAAFAGSIGGLIGTPFTKINVRMTNDLTLISYKRRNYKNVFDGVIRIYSTEGFSGLFAGGVTNTARGALMSITQLAFYDELANKYIRNGEDHNNMATHFEASLISGIAGAILTEPFNVIRARLMEGYPRGLHGLWDIIIHTAKYSHNKFYKGFVPSFFQVVPQTILTYMFLEQLRINFGIPYQIDTIEKPSSLRNP